MVGVTTSGAESFDALSGIGSGRRPPWGSGNLDGVGDGVAGAASPSLPPAESRGDFGVRIPGVLESPPNLDPAPADGFRAEESGARSKVNPP